MLTRQLAVLALASGFAMALGACSSSDELSAPPQESDPTVENTDKNAKPSAAELLPPEGVPGSPRDPSTDPADPTAPVDPTDSTAPATSTTPTDPTDPADATTDDPMGNPSL